MPLAIALSIPIWAVTISSNAIPVASNMVTSSSFQIIKIVEIFSSLYPQLNRYTT